MKYLVCERIASNIIQVGCNLKLEIEIFIGEILESSYSQLRVSLQSLKTSYQNVEYDKKLQTDMSKYVHNIIKYYESDNVQKVYEALSKFRCRVTYHQFNMAVFGGEEYAKY